MRRQNERNFKGCSWSVGDLSAVWKASSLASIGAALLVHDVVLLLIIVMIMMMEIVVVVAMLGSKKEVQPKQHGKVPLGYIRYI